MDKKFVKLQITNDHNEILEESELILNPGDTLVAQVPKDTTRAEAHEVLNAVKCVLSGESEALVIPDSIKLIVIKKN